MARFRIDPSTDSAPVLDRVIEAYGFTQKMQLAEHLDMAASSLSSRYKRGGLPADIMVKCMAETGVSLEWLATGSGKKFESDELDIMKFPRKKLVDGQLFDSGNVMFDK
uniref:helix-turn-helix transcriptional regulator n=2 Tax=Citrobacter TaxID=544 RepID=UPI003A980ACC